MVELALQTTGTLGKAVAIKICPGKSMEQPHKNQH